MDGLHAPSLILASASPRRKDMLEQLGFHFQCLAPDVSEETLPGESPEAYVRRVALDKARAVRRIRSAPEPNESLLIIAGDTTVTLNNRILGKPATPAEALDMLMSLSGHTHQVLTGVCLLLHRPGHPDTERLFSVSTDVEFKTLTRREAEAYVRTGDPMDKAGAYGIQSGAAYMIRAIRGSYTNVVGMPMTELYEELLALGARTDGWSHD